MFGLGSMSNGGGSFPSVSAALMYMHDYPCVISFSSLYATAAIAMMDGTKHGKMGVDVDESFVLATK
jgi:hypothetical protein